VPWPFTLAEPLHSLWTALGGDVAKTPQVRYRTIGNLPSRFAVSDLAAASVAVAGLSLVDCLVAGGHPAVDVTVDRRLASMWFASSYQADGWTPPSPWDPIAGDYATEDGWIRLHTNAPHHRDAALAVLKVSPDRTTVAKAVRRWSAEELEVAVVAAGGCAAAMRSLSGWDSHPQGMAVAAEPLIGHEKGSPSPYPEPPLPANRPLTGIRVLDLTRVLAGPVATRFVAGFGANVLRLDPPFWDEPALLPDITLGKRCARVDLRAAEDRTRFQALLGQADILVHGYRPDALDGLGFGRAWRQAVRPGLIDVCPDAYGWTGPWAGRRGFDSLVQMSSGIAQAGMVAAGSDRPRPLPVQALDHATGYLLAAAALRGLAQRRRTGHGSVWRTSLARIGCLLTNLAQPADIVPFAPPVAADFLPSSEMTAWGPLRRLRPPVTITGIPMRWDHPATPLGTDPAQW
jgi:hypothetical protein